MLIIMLIVYLMLNILCQFQLYHGEAKKSWRAMTASIEKNNTMWASCTPTVFVGVPLSPLNLTFNVLYHTELFYHMS